MKKKIVNEQYIRFKKLANLISESEYVRLVEAEDDAEMEKDLTDLFKKDYASFVKDLGDFAKDPKFRQFIKSGATEQSTVKRTAISVKDLKPTQNEIDVDKSLQFPLTDGASAQNCLKGGAVMIAKPIISFNGEYIIDGHHRWSQLYAMNPDAKIVAFDFSNPKVKGPIGALKLAQLAIVATGASKIPSQDVKGKNLLQMGEKDVKAYVTDKITDNCINALAEKEIVKGEGEEETKKEAADYIWTNVKSMQATSQPVSGAPGRGLMPQADDVSGGQQNTIDKIKAGVQMPTSLSESRAKLEKLLSESVRKSTIKTRK